MYGLIKCFMDKFTCTLFLWTLSLTLAGQHRLSQQLNSMRASDKLLKQQVEFKDPGSSGRNLIWDFRMLNQLNHEYPLNYFIPDSTHMDTICGMEHQTRYYYSQKRDSIWATGFENATTLMEYKQPELRMKFPFSYGDTLFSYFKGEGEYSRRLKLSVSGYTRIEADAEGTLKLPGFEDVKNALRVRTMRYYTETGKDSTEMMIDTYAWYAEGVRYPVFESIKTDIIKRKRRNAGVSDTTIFKTSFYYPPHYQTYQLPAETITDTPPETAVGIAAVFTEVSYMPNPVETNLTISYKLTRPARIGFSVHNNVGIIVRQSPARNMPEGYNQTNIPMSNTLTGTYTLYVFVDDMVVKQVVVKK